MTIGFNFQTSLLTPNTNINWGIDQAFNTSLGNNLTLMNGLCMPSVGAGDSIPYCMDYNTVPLLGFGGLCYSSPSLFISGCNTNTIQNWQNLGNSLGNALSLPFFKLGDAIENFFCG